MNVSPRVVIFLLPGVLSLDAFGPFEAFSCASVLSAQRSLGWAEDPGGRVPDALRAYRVELVGLHAGPVPAMNGTHIVAQTAADTIEDPFDTLLVAGGDLRFTRESPQSKDEAIAEVQRLASLARRVAATCTATFILALAGLLEGRRATSHWAFCETLRATFPQIEIDAQPIYVKDGKYYTSAGGTAGIDLALALIAEDHGNSLANAVARFLVLYIQRPQAQAQLSIPLVCQRADSKDLRDLQTFILDNLRADLSVPALADRVVMGVRTFSRRFKQEVGLTPARYVESIRVEAGLRKLQLGQGSVAQIADEVGFGSAETFRRSVERCYGECPSALRETVSLDGEGMR